MKRSFILLPAVASAAMLFGSAYAQLAPQTVTLMKVDPQTLATGYRASKMIGSSVVNETNEAVGSLDDLIITPGGQAPYVILSVGGFLGLGDASRGGDYCSAKRPCVFGSLTILHVLS
jgi:PRC-barrel domain